jgi:uncharacterized protein
MLAITEATYFIREKLGDEAEKRFLDDIVAGIFQIEPVTNEDWPRVAHLVGKYKNLPLGTVDASVVAAAERLNIGQVATVDRTGFQCCSPQTRERIHSFAASFAFRLIIRLSDSAGC